MKKFTVEEIEDLLCQVIMGEISLPEIVDKLNEVCEMDEKSDDIPKPKYKEGDFVYEDGRIMIIKSYPNTYHALIYPQLDLEVVYNDNYASPIAVSSLNFRHAAEEEKQLLIDAMKKDGKPWNAEKLEIEGWLEPYTEKLKKGDLAIFWDDNKDHAIIRIYNIKGYSHHSDNYGHLWENAIKFESKEQFERLVKGEI